MYYKVYLLLAHKKPEQLKELITLLQDERSFFFVHIDKSVDITLFSSLKHIDRCEFVTERTQGRWGGFGIVQGTLNGLQCITEFMQKNYAEAAYHCIILSGEDIPLKSNRYIHDYLERYKTYSFIHHWKLPYKDWWNGGLFRFESIYAFDFNTQKGAHKLLNKAIKTLGLHFLLPVNRIKKTYPNLELYGSSQWMILSKQLATSIVKASRTHLKFKKLFNYVLLPDELYIITLVHNFLKPECLLIKNIPSHLIIFSGNDANPHYLTKEDILTNSKDSTLFARKFDTQINGDAMTFIKEDLLR